LLMACGRQDPAFESYRVFTTACVEWP